MFCIAVAAIWLAALPFLSDGRNSVPDSVLAAAVFGGGLPAISLGMDKLLKPDTLGGGDIRLFAVAGLYLGLIGSLLALEATCTEAGHTAGKKCSACGTVLEGLEEIPAAHKPEAEPAVENEIIATCIREGRYDEVIYCSMCETELTRTPVKTGTNPDNHAGEKKKTGVKLTADIPGGWYASTAGGILLPDLRNQKKTQTGKTTNGMKVRKQCLTRTDPGSRRTG